MLYVASVFAADSNQCLPINLALFKVSSSVYDHFSNKIVIVKNFDNMNYFYARFKLLFENDMQSVLIIPDLDEQYLKIEKQKKKIMPFRRHLYIENNFSEEDISPDCGDMICSMFSCKYLNKLCK